ncbi:MAG: adenosylcobinamide-GDP ribazoletransferase [Desulfobacterales bacterium]|nr:adenosylcobinamide-GDP ribazoletransferase [Deltaproteobacteria bacterium]NNK95305.1 adenosylcobinamide-GDP ribazoletransferase [Desulfobacterales bacterium]
MIPKHIDYSRLQAEAANSVKSFLAAIRFLTVFPTFSSSADDSIFFGRSLYFFAPTGLLTGFVCALVAMAFGVIAPPILVAALVAICLSLISGFFHLDGLADTADGFMSARSSDRCLEIMRDSRIGVMGAAAVTSLFLTKTAALYSIEHTELIAALVIASVAGRTAIVVTMAFLPYARQDGGLGELFYSTSTKSSAVISSLLLLAIVLFCNPAKLFLVMAAIILTTASFSYLSLKRIGGATGDTLGAVCELNEAAVLVAFTLFTQGS